jgi:hypothetical protein
MMLPSDMALTKDKEFKKHAKAYASDSDLFFNEYVFISQRIHIIANPSTASPRSSTSSSNSVSPLRSSRPTPTP